MKPKSLKLRKDTITRLNEQNLKTLVGGRRTAEARQQDQSCYEDSCPSQTTAGSCNNHSCNCP